MFGWLSEPHHIGATTETDGEEKEEGKEMYRQEQSTVSMMDCQEKNMTSDLSFFI